MQKGWSKDIIEWLLVRVCKLAVQTEKLKCYPACKRSKKIRIEYMASNLYSVASIFLTDVKLEVNYIGTNI